MYYNYTRCVTIIVALGEQMNFVISRLRTSIARVYVRTMNDRRFIMNSSQFPKIESWIVWAAPFAENKVDTAIICLKNHATLKD